jgi:hypothetical protein
MAILGQKSLFCQNTGQKFAKVLVKNLPKSWFWIILRPWNTENA